MFYIYGAWCLDLYIRVCSSVGLSTRLISVGSVVQIHPDPPRNRGCSSDGRAPALQAGGHRFDPVHLHQAILFVKDQCVIGMSYFLSIKI